MIRYFLTGFPSLLFVLASQFIAEIELLRRNKGSS